MKSGNDEGWVHGGYLAKAGSGATEPTPTPTPTPGGGACAPRKLRFSADELPSLPAAGSAYVWGANATGGASAPYSSEFISYAAQAHQRGLQVFAYLEGPCGDTGGVDDGERARCSGIHRSFNAQNAPGTPNTDKARWKPFTMHQLKRSAQVGADYCEIDNLSNNVTIPLNPLLREIKALYDSGQVHCRFVLKNVEAADIDSHSDRSGADAGGGGTSSRRSTSSKPTTRGKGPARRRDGSAQGAWRQDHHQHRHEPLRRRSSPRTSSWLARSGTEPVPPHRFAMRRPPASSKVRGPAASQARAGATCTGAPVWNAAR
ncbi:MAG: hypothetical protein IPG50_30970 [Myxococcales bacterium]|nr:hypothetical protein [Myxococcales bacterium]